MGPIDGVVTNAATGVTCIVRELPKIKIKQNIIAIGLLILTSQPVFSQGFVNLDFESATITQVPGFPYFVYASNAIPAWTAYLGGNSQEIIGYDTVSLGGAAVFFSSAVLGSLTGRSRMNRISQLR